MDFFHASQFSRKRLILANRVGALTDVQCEKGILQLIPDIRSRSIFKWICLYDGPSNLPDQVSEPRQDILHPLVNGIQYMVIILNGNSNKVAHSRRKIGIFVEKKSDL